MRQFISRDRLLTGVDVKKLFSFLRRWPSLENISTESKTVLPHAGVVIEDVTLATLVEAAAMKMQPTLL